MIRGHLKPTGESPSAAPGSFDGFGYAVQRMAVNTAWRNTKYQLNDGHHAD